MVRTLTLFIFACVLLVDPAASQDAQPLDGEGAYGLLQRNGIKPSSVILAQFRDLNPGKFTNDGGLRAGESYRLPVRVVNEPLFGETYRIVDIKSDALAGTVWYLIGGHGGEDTGASAVYNGRRIYEDEIAYDTMLRFGRLLLESGATVYFMTKDDDGIRDQVYLPADHDERFYDDTYVGQGRRKRLHTRTDQINRLARRHGGQYQRVVEFHVDNYDASRQFDVSFFYWSIPGEHLARRLHKTLENKYREYRPERGFYGRLRKERFHTLRNARPVVAYIELGNIQNYVDQQRLLQPEKRQTIAEWLFDGFMEDVRVNNR